MARVYIDTWRHTYRGILPDTYLDAMELTDSQRSFEKEIADSRIIGRVAESAKHGVVGFVTGGVERHRDCVYEGEIFTLYVLRSFQRQGIGIALVASLVEHLNRLEIFSVLVQVLKENPYRRFYEKIDGVLLGSSRIRFAGVELTAFNYGWIDTDMILARQTPPPRGD